MRTSSMRTFSRLDTTALRPRAEKSSWRRFPSRTASASRPRFSLLSAGPTPYAGQVLPDQSIVDEVTGFVPGMNLLKTNTHDRVGGPGNPDRCPTKDRVGVDDDAPGGCDNAILELSP